MQVSLDGKLVAAVDENYALCVWGRDRSRHALTTSESGFRGVAWAPDSREILYVGGRSGSQALRAVGLSGRERVVLPSPSGDMYLHDIDSEGRVLLERSSGRAGLACRAPGESSERELGWLDISQVRGLSDDGQVVLFSETGNAEPGGGVYIRRTDGSPAIRLGSGDARDLSPDGRFALVLTGPPPEIVVLPTGPGSSRKVDTGGIQPMELIWLPDGEHFAILHLVQPGQLAIAIVGPRGGPRRTVLVPGLGSHRGTLSPDGTEGVHASSDGVLIRFSLSGGPAHELPGPPLAANDFISQWSDDGRFLYIADVAGVPGRILRREIATGTTTTWAELRPSDPAGVINIFPVVKVTRDGRAYAYSYGRIESSDLFVVDGLL